ncbi:MAG: ATP-binding protein [Prolixibacteraceae bacterium]|nr:ATP-binding protein [Prolixibacteraceae bacterium]
MDRLYTWSYQRIRQVNTNFKRYLYNKIDWNAQLSIIIGMRGVGKTTLMLQYAKENLPFNESTIYISLDDIFFSSNTLIDFVEEFHKRNGKYLLIDEVQKYEGWSREIKLIYDNFPEIKMLVSGSFAIGILKGEGDLSRRGIIHRLQGMSFREYVNFKYGLDLPVVKLQDLIESPLEIAFSINEKIKPIKLFEDYLLSGHYPFSVGDEKNFNQRMMQVVNTIIETDLPSVHRIDYNAVLKMKRLLAIIAESVPFKPNVKKLAEKLTLSRDTLLKYFQLLASADIIILLFSSTKGISALNKPEKVYLNNPNLAFLFAKTATDIGNLRETFFINQLQGLFNVEYPEQGDFLVDGKYLFEVGGKNKSARQIAGKENAFVVSDNIELPVGDKIPLWMFGCLY